MAKTRFSKMAKCLTLGPATNDDDVKKYGKIEDIQNGDIFDPINSKFYHAEVAQARKLTGKEVAKTCWEVTLRIDGELDRKTDSQFILMLPFACFFKNKIQSALQLRDRSSFFFF